MFFLALNDQLTAEREPRDLSLPEICSLQFILISNTYFLL